MRTGFVPALLLAVAAAQRPSAFAELQLPGGLPPSVQSLGKLVHLEDAGTLHVWSAQTRRWDTLAITPGAPTYQTNDVLLVQDATVWTAFGAARGRFAPLPVTPGAFLWNPTTQTNDAVLLVLDAGQLHAFSGYTGRWVSRPIGPAAQLAVRRHTAVAQDGGTLMGFDPFAGQWVDLPNALPQPLPPVQLSADGVCGAAITPAAAHAFSALRGEWTTAPLALPGTLVRDDDWFVVHDGAVALGFSGLTGAFASEVTGPLVRTDTEDVLGVLHGALGAHAYSAITGTFQLQTLSPTATVTTAPSVALIEDTAVVHAFAAARGTWSTLAIDAGAAALAGAVAAVTARSDGRAALFSGLLGQWFAPPLDAQPGMPRLSTVGALLATANGFRAFSARSGAFVPLVAAGGTAESNDSSAPLVVWDSAALHCFDDRHGRWVAAPRTGGGTPTVNIWRTEVLAFDGGELLGFGAQAGVIERRPLLQPITSFRVNSESARLSTPSSVIAHSAVPLACPIAQYPEFRRVLVRDAAFRLHLRLLSGELALLGYGPALAAPAPLGGLGDLVLDPGGAATLLLL
ncbi:MAG: hypothetical protein AB7O97_21620, partial [Planctomycetota bacterium]